MPIPAFTDPPTTSRAPYTYVPPPPSPKPESEKNLPFVDAKLGNDCLLTADQGQVLTGLPKLTPRQERIPKRDGEFIDACYYEVVQTAAPGGALNMIVPLPKMEIDVYQPVPGWTTARVLDHVDGKPLALPSGRSVLVRDPRGDALWVSDGSRIGVVGLYDQHPSDQAFATAGQLAVAALATR